MREHEEFHFVVSLDHATADVWARDAETAMWVAEKITDRKAKSAMKCEKCEPIWRL
jgi:hypothetical protein